MQYTREFYHAIEAESRASAAEIVPRVLQLVRPDSVVDVGCGTGVWLAEIMRHGVEDVIGVDFRVNLDDLRIDKENFWSADLEGPVTLDRSFDLAMALEVAEHLPEQSAEQFVKSLVNLAPVVLFSAAIPYQGGVHHVNEQWPAYWANCFAQYDYVPVDCLRQSFWENDRVAWWYAQNSVFYVRRDVLPKYPELAAFGSALPLPLVHPSQYLGYADPVNRIPGSKELIRALPRALLNSIKRKLVGRGV